MVEININVSFSDNIAIANINKKIKEESTNNSNSVFVINSRIISNSFIRATMAPV